MNKETMELRLAQWAGIIKEQKQSGLTVKDWCSQNGITKDSYYYWQQKLRKEIYETIKPQESIFAPVPNEVLLEQTAVSEHKNSSSVTLRKGKVTVEIADCSLNPDIITLIREVIKDAQ
ncbi:MAG: hypothetical protein IJ167_10725 [Lachnospiraceae bacterium]|nr:hypothetical protein [Lachnospiraceae bacterium]